MTTDHLSPGDPIALGIDIGTTNTKVVAATPRLELQVVSAPTPYNPVTLRSEIAAIVRTVVASLPRPPSAIGIASMAETGVPLGADDRPLGSFIRWQDGHLRASAPLPDAEAEQLYGLTGVRPGPKPTIGMLAVLRTTDPDRAAAMVRWAGIADWIHLALTGVLRTDHTLAGRTMGYRLPTAGAGLSHTFDPDLVARIGLRPDQFPHVGLPGDALDTVSPDAAQATGLRPGTPVLVAGHDHQVGAWAAGVREVGDAADSVGTAEAVMTVVGEVPGPRQGLGRHGFSVVRAIDGLSEVVLAGAPSSGAFLQWCADRWGHGGVAALLAAIPTPDPSCLPSGELLLPYPTGRQCPHPDGAATVRAVRHGAGSATATVDPGIQAIEAVCAQAQWLWQEQRTSLGWSPHGGSLTVLGQAVRRNQLWQVVKAAFAGDRIRLVDVDQPVATGAALLALVRSGWIDPATRLPRLVIHPKPALVRPYRIALDAFVAAALDPSGRAEGDRTEHQPVTPDSAGDVATPVQFLHGSPPAPRPNSQER